MDLWNCGNLWSPSSMVLYSPQCYFLFLIYATLNARMSGHRLFWTHVSLIMNARNFFRAFMIRLLCVRNGLCPDFPAFKFAYVQTIVRSHLPMSRLSCCQRYLWSDHRAFKVAYVQTIMCSKLRMSRLSCVQNCICPDYRAFIFSRP